MAYKGLAYTIACFLISLPAWAGLEIFFSPSLKCEKELIELIDNAKESIDVCVYSINNNNIVEALKKAHKKGLKIRILTDKLQASSRYSKVIELYKYGLNIRVHSKYKLEHNKFAIFDNEVASSGSYNWTNPATSKNSENCIFFVDNAKAVAEYQKRFNYLWQINTKKKSEKWFNKKLNIL